MEKLKHYFDIHHLFPLTNKLLFMSSCIVRVLEIDCHMAREMGMEDAKQITGNLFGKVSFKRKDKVQTLASMSTSMK